MIKKNNCISSCNKNHKIIYNIKTENFIFCKQCSTLYRKNIDEYKNKVINFEKFNKNVKDVISTEYYRLQIDEHKSILKKILKKIKKKPEFILDYGCGYGVFMFAAKEKGYAVEGYDINKNFTTNLDLYFKTYKSEEELSKVTLDKKFDLIFCKKVLTLSPNIYGDFSNFDKLLSPTGTLVIMDQVKNLSKYKSILSGNNDNNTLLLTIETLNFFGNIFKLRTKYLENDFGDVLIMFEKSDFQNNKKKISIKTLENYEKLSSLFMCLSKIKNLIKNLIKKSFINSTKPI